MRELSIQRRIVNSIFLTLLIFGNLIDVQAISPSTQVESVQSTFLSSQKSYVIDGNFAFQTLAIEEEWDGNGSFMDPFVITGLIFDHPDGLVILNTDVFFQIVNCIFYGSTNGIFLSNVTNGLIANNTLSNHSRSAILLDNSRNNTIQANNIINSSTGIRCEYSEAHVIKDNYLVNNRYGIFLYTGSSHVVKNNTIINSFNGLYLFHSTNNQILCNQLLNTYFYIEGRKVTDFLQSDFSNNTINYQPLVFWQNRRNLTTPSAGELILINCTNIMIFAKKFTGSPLAILTAFSSNITVLNNTFQNNNRNAIIFKYSENSSILRNTFHTTNTAINIVYSRNIVISLNNMTNCNYGIRADYSTGNFFVNNSFEDGNIGLYIYLSNNNEIVSNQFFGTGLLMDGETLDDFIQIKVVGNQVNSKPLIFLQHQNNVTISDSSGQIFLINCTNVEIINQYLSHSTVGAEIIHSSDIVIYNNSFEYNFFSGLYHLTSNLSTISHNSFLNNSYGLYLISFPNGLTSSNLWTFSNISGNLFSSNNIGAFLYRLKGSYFFNNTVTNCFEGVLAGNCHENIFESNSISNNSYYGLHLYDAWQNTIQWNIFLQNNLEGTSQAYSNGNNSFQYNFWDDWTTPDINRDGIVDYPYLIDGFPEVYDFYPRVSSDASLPQSSEIPTMVLYGSFFLALILISLFYISRKKNRFTR